MKMRQDIDKTRGEGAMEKKLCIIVGIAVLVGLAATAWAAGTAVPVKIDDVTGSPGDTKEVGITAGDLSGTNMTAGDITVTYDPAKLTLVANTGVMPGTLTANWATEVAPTAAEQATMTVPWHFPVYKDTAGQVKIAIYGKTPVNAAGTLAKLDFTVNAGASGTSTITLNNATLYSYTTDLTKKEADQAFPVTLGNGTFTITGGAVVGDVNGDGVVSLADVQLVVNYIVDGKFIPTGDLLYDVNKDGKWNIADYRACANIYAAQP